MFCFGVVSAFSGQQLYPESLNVVNSVFFTGLDNVIVIEELLLTSFQVCPLLLLASWIALLIDSSYRISLQPCPSHSNIFYTIF